MTKMMAMKKMTNLINHRDENKLERQKNDYRHFS